jgi:hypothetical protein
MNEWRKDIQTARKRERMESFLSSGNFCSFSVQRKQAVGQERKKTFAIFSFISNLKMTKLFSLAGNLLVPCMTSHASKHTPTRANLIHFHRQNPKMKSFKC